MAGRAQGLTSLLGPFHSCCLPLQILIPSEARDHNCLFGTKTKAPLEIELGLLPFQKMFYFTLAKMMTSVYSASDSIRASPRIRAN